MQNKLKYILVFSFLILVSVSSHAQNIKTPKMDIPELDLSTQVLGILNNTDGLNLNANQKEKLTENNRGFADELMNISKSGKSDVAMKAAFLGLKDKRAGFLMKLLGSDLLKKYSGNVLKSINPLKGKLGLAALAF